MIDHDNLEDFRDPQIYDLQLENAFQFFLTREDLEAMLARVMGTFASRGMFSL